MELWLCEQCPLRYTTVQERCACGGRLLGADELLDAWRLLERVKSAAIPVIETVRAERRRIGHMVDVVNTIEHTWGDVLCGPETKAPA